MEDRREGREKEEGGGEAEENAKMVKVKEEGVKKDEKEEGERKEEEEGEEERKGEGERKEEEEGKGEKSLLCQKIFCSSCQVRIM